MTLGDRVTWRYKKFLAWMRMNRHKRLMLKMDGNQRLAYNIIKELISDAQANLRIAPISGTLYVEKGKFFVKIGHQEVKIINSTNDRNNNKYLFDVYLQDEAIADLRLHFNKRAEYKRMKMEEEIFKNIKVSLQMIHDNLKNND